MEKRTHLTNKNLTLKYINNNETIFVIFINYKCIIIFTSELLIIKPYDS